MASQSSEGFVYCAVCRTKSPKNSSRCINCGFPFSGDAMAVSGQKLPPSRYELLQADSDILPGRPGCLTLYILILLLGGAGIALVLATPSINRSLYGVLGGALPSEIYPVLAAAGAVLLISLAGLFFMRNWARIFQIGLLIVALVALIPFLLWGFRNPRIITNWNTLGLVLGSAVFILIALRWFWTNGKRFS